MEITPLDAWIEERIDCKGRLTRAALEKRQLARLRFMIEQQRQNSRYYRSHLPPELGLPETLADLARFPMTSETELRDDPPAFICVSQSKVQRIVTLDTSGTGGAPKRLYFTTDDILRTVDFFKVGMSTFTRPGDRVLILLPDARPDSVGDLLYRGLEELGAQPFKHGPVLDVAETLDQLEQHAIQVLVGAPVQVLRLARGSAARRLAVRDVLLTTDPVSRAIQSAVEQTWGCRVYNHYGMTEMGLGGGVDCAARGGMHLREADMYFEVVDPATGKQLPEGEEGEIVVSTFSQHAMPLLRYRTGDIGRFVPGACPCGTVLRRLEHVTRRAAGVQRLSNGRVLALCDLDEALFPLEGVLDFAATLARGEPDVLELAVVIVPGMENGLAMQVAQRAQAVCGLEVKVTLQTEPVARAHAMSKRVMGIRQGGIFRE